MPSIEWHTSTKLVMQNNNIKLQLLNVLESDFMIIGLVLYLGFQVDQGIFDLLNYFGLF